MTKASLTNRKTIMKLVRTLTLIDAMGVARTVSIFRRIHRHPVR